MPQMLLLLLNKQNQWLSEKWHGGDLSNTKMDLVRSSILLWDVAIIMFVLSGSIHVASTVHSLAT